MFFRSPALALAALISSTAFAQADEPSPPPMVPVEEPAPSDVQPAPWPGQPQQPAPQQTYAPSQPYAPQPEAADASQPQQPFQQLPPYQPGQQNRQYSNAPVEDVAPPAPASQPPRAPNRPAPTETESSRAMTSTRTKHFLGLLSGAVGVSDTTSGAVGNLRAEIDIWRISLLGSYSIFSASIPGFFGYVQVHQVNAMAGYAFFSSDLLTFRLLGGVDFMTRDGVTAVGPIIGTNLRTMWGRFGLDGAVMVTLVPFRQVEARAALVLRWWSIFEAHLGWRVQVVDATLSGDLGTLFTSSPTVTGPVAAIGLTF